MRICLVRHGLSASNVAGLVTGTPADELVEKGREQAIALGSWLRDNSHQCPDAFFVSHWARARQTATLVWPDAEWEEDSRLGETNAGEVAQLSREAFLLQHPEFYSNLSNSYPGGESHFDLNRRVLSFWDDLLRRDVQNVVVATHSGPISCMLQHVVGVPMERFPAFLPGHATVSVLETEPSSPTYVRLRAFSCGPNGLAFLGGTGE